MLLVVGLKKIKEDDVVYVLREERERERSVFKFVVVFEFEREGVAEILNIGFVFVLVAFMKNENKILGRVSS